MAAWRRRTSGLVERFGGRCSLCGYGRCVAALHFHHLDPTRRTFGLAQRGSTRSIERLVVEAEKCILLCSNCHAEVEAGIVGVGPRDAQTLRPTGAE